MPAPHPQEVAAEALLLLLQRPLLVHSELLLLLLAHDLLETLLLLLRCLARHAPAYAAHTRQWHRDRSEVMTNPSSACLSCQLSSYVHASRQHTSTARPAGYIPAIPLSRVLTPDPGVWVGAPLDHAHKVSSLSENF